MRTSSDTFPLDAVDRPSRPGFAGPRGSRCRGYSSAGDLDGSQAGMPDVLLGRGRVGQAQLI